MALFCRLCGTRTDGVERLDVYCPGEHCGSDLRAGPDAGVQAWCEPPRRYGETGGTVTVDLIVHNAGPRATGYHVEPVEPVDGRLDFDRRVVDAPLAPGRTRRVELRYTLPPDRLGTGLDIASRFGVPGADLAGQLHGARSSRFGVALRVVATSAPQGAACAAFAVDVPGRIDPDLDLDRNDGRGDGRNDGRGDGGNDGRGDGRNDGRGDGGNDGRGDGGRTRQPDGGRSGPQARPGQQPPPGLRAPSRRAGGCGPVAVVVLVLVLVVVMAAVAVRVLGSDRDEEAGVGPSGPATGAVQPTGHPTDGGSAGGATGGGTGKPSPSPSRSRTSSPTPTPTPTPRVIVLPDLAGLGQAAAEAKLRTLGLTPDPHVVEGRGVPALQVVGTDPVAGAKVLLGSTVSLRVSDGRARIPDVVGMTRADAEQALRAAHFTAVTVYSQETTTVPDGQAIRTDPAKGTSVALDAPITLWFAVRPRPPR
ncbi:PASTA domain-containing protein [Kitasatospora sp. NPDC050463]|uniref:PASTA domain-containing protein n=1 Tax=Kitasatospora sp. NPDC050463 TaxID=3155786 RepID=UPI0033D49B8F